MSEDIGIIARNRNGRGGGVAVAYRNTAVTMKEFSFPDNRYEVVCAVGNFSTFNLSLIHI